MSIAFDAETYNTASAATSLTISHTPSGTPNLVVAVFWLKVGTDDVTGVTYNGVPMTKVDWQPNSPINSKSVHMYYLANPSSGTQDLVITTSGAQDIRGSAITYTGADTSTPLDASNKDSGLNGPTITCSLTTTASDTAVIVVAEEGRTYSSAGTNTTVMQTGNPRIARSTTNIATASSTSLSWTDTASGAYATYVIASFNSAGAASSNIKSIAGVTQANIKSMAGITNANIKSVVGVTNT